MNLPAVKSVFLPLIVSGMTAAIALDKVLYCQVKHNFDTDCQRGICSIRVRISRML